eukprot:gene22854-9256_t
MQRENERLCSQEREDTPPSFTTVRDYEEEVSPLRWVPPSSQQLTMSDSNKQLQTESTPNLI